MPTLMVILYQDGPTLQGQRRIPTSMCLMRMLWDARRFSVKTKQNRRQFGDRNTPMLLVPPQPGLILME